MVEPRSHPQSSGPPSSSHSWLNSNDAAPLLSTPSQPPFPQPIPLPQPTPILSYGANGSSDDPSGKDNVPHSDSRNAATIMSASSLRPNHFNPRAPKRIDVLRRHHASPSRIEPIGRSRRSGILSNIGDRISFQEMPTTSLATAHYTISQDHTGGEESRRSQLFAGFGRKHQRHLQTRRSAASQSNASPATVESLDPSFAPLFDGGGMELAKPLNSGDVLNDFDFDSFLHSEDGSQ
ncbi:hypothetical protein FOMA001_g17903 [Fusarium oxysporum f. sp. matthiolae]|nr:hypothetical protein FOMA001_g17903 [Fusarium oxysporum f. sp. matthiolae]